MTYPASWRFDPCFSPHPFTPSVPLSACESQESERHTRISRYNAVSSYRPHRYIRQVVISFINSFWSQKYRYSSASVAVLDRCASVDKPRPSILLHQIPLLSTVSTLLKCFLITQSSHGEYAHPLRIRPSPDMLCPRMQPFQLYWIVLVAINLGLYFPHWTVPPLLFDLTPYFDNLDNNNLVVWCEKEATRTSFQALGRTPLQRVLLSLIHI